MMLIATTIDLTMVESDLPCICTVNPFGFEIDRMNPQTGNENGSSKENASRSRTVSQSGFCLISATKSESMVNLYSHTAMTGITADEPERVAEP